MAFSNISLANGIPVVLYYTRSKPCSTVFFQRALVLSLSLLRAFAPILLLLLLSTIIFSSVQRRIIYGHKSLFSSKSSSNAVLDHPESLGFLQNQVTTHFIRTSDGENLYSWLIMPLGAYTKHEAVLAKSWSADEAREIALQIVKSDTKAVIVVYFHGSGNHLATQWRCEAYQNLLAVEPDHLYVLAFDPRGFGKSSGSPTEEGLIVDGSSVLGWVNKRLGVPRARTLLIGHSLGAAIAVASMERLLSTNRFAEYAGIVLCSNFTSIPDLAPCFKAAGIVPLLRPLMWSKRGRGWVKNNLFVDLWPTELRLKNLVHISDNLKLSIMHANDDDRIPCMMSAALYNICVEQLRQKGTVIEQQIPHGAAYDIAQAKLGFKLIRCISLGHGGHNNYMNWHLVSLEVMKLLTMTGAIR